MESLAPAIFVDRDGTLNEMVYDATHGTLDSPRTPQQVTVRPGASSFLKTLKARGYLIILVTNQPGVAKGTLSLAGLESVNHQLLTLLNKDGAAWDDLYFCPHHPSFTPGGDPEYTMACQCRKPLPGMLLEAAARHKIDLTRSWMVGDGLNDVQAGRRAGCKTCLVTSLKIEQVERFFSLEDAMPDQIAGNLDQACSLIL